VQTRTKFGVRRNKCWNRFVRTECHYQSWTSESRMAKRHAEGRFESNNSLLTAILYEGDAECTHNTGNC